MKASLVEKRLEELPRGGILFRESANRGS